LSGLIPHQPSRLTTHITPSLERTYLHRLSVPKERKYRTDRNRYPDADHVHPILEKCVNLVSGTFSILRKIPRIPPPGHLVWSLRFHLDSTGHFVLDFSNHNVYYLSAASWVWEAVMILLKGGPFSPCVWRDPFLRGHGPPIYSLLCSCRRGTSGLFRDLPHTSQISKFGLDMGKDYYSAKGTTAPPDGKQNDN